MTNAILRSLTRVAVAAACVLGASLPASAQPKEVVIGMLYPLTGPTAQAGVDSKAAAELAVEIVNGRYDLDLPLAKTQGLPKEPRPTMIASQPVWSKARPASSAVRTSPLRITGT